MPYKYVDSNFLSEDFSDTEKLVDLIRYAIDRLKSTHDLKLPVLSPDSSFEYKNIAKNFSISLESSSPSDVIDCVIPYFKNCINWNSAGSMFNVAPPVNIVSVALNTVVSMLNPNLAEDRSSGLLAYAEQEIVNALGKDLLEWEGNISGMACFGGKATNLYGISKALSDFKLRSKEKFKIEEVFYVITEKGHPAQEEVAMLQYLSMERGNLIIAPCSASGKLDISELKKIVLKNLQDGKKWLGVTINAGTTTEYIVDDIKEVVDFRNEVHEKYKLESKPKIHADAVLGWVWLFMKKLDRVKVDNKFISEAAIAKCLSMLADLQDLKLVDSLGIDFHKLGFVPYQSSFFIYRSSDTVVRAEAKFGDLTTYKHTIELSRGGQGIVGALASLMSLGYEGYINIILNLVEATEKIRLSLSAHPNIKILDMTCRGPCSVFSFLPDKLKQEKDFSAEELNKIRKMNLSFVNFMDQRLKTGESELFFSNSRSYVAPGSNIKYGGIKLYATSPHLHGNRLDEIISSLLASISAFLSTYKDTDASNVRILGDGFRHPIN